MQNFFNVKPPITNEVKVPNKPKRKAAFKMMPSKKLAKPVNAEGVVALPVKPTTVMQNML